MSADKILYVDDEPMALKYFERLVSPLAPVITALSVEQGKAVLRERGDEIAVLVTDQRMPGAHGNELLRYTREFHPRIVRMLTTAYSELGEAIEAINSGEIYRYITKPWELASLHADLRNALELAQLRNERDHLLREKLLVQQQQLLGSRLASLAMLGAGVVRADSNAALHRYARTALAAGCHMSDLAWHQWDHAGLLQAEARRGIAIAQALGRWQDEFGDDRTPERAFALLAQALGGQAQGDSVRLSAAAPLTALLDAAPGEVPPDGASAWLAWLLWWNAPVELKVAEGGAAGEWTLRAASAPEEAAPPPDWLERVIEQFAEGPLDR
ncbi:response regulator [Polaromonas sp.]|uniref:response regulator n=1 Tax=Polaromonas sp. TaxID=1869339 RepID=UPI00286D610A|nr:response regulator [Polaromonas sp.]